MHLPDNEAVQNSKLAPWGQGRRKGYLDCRMTRYALASFCRGAGLGLAPCRFSARIMPIRANICRPAHLGEAEVATLPRLAILVITFT